MDANDTSDNAQAHPNRVVIELDKSLAAQVFKNGDGLIQRSAMRDVRRFAKDTADKILNFRNELENKERPPLVRSRVHETIFITGERGSGKTTFMLNVLQEAQDSFPDGGKNGKLPYHFEPLPIIDPTHLTDKQHIFVNIIALIKESVDRHFDKNKIVECREAQQREWREMLRELSRGLCNQDGIGSNKLLGSEWDDPQYILKEGLEDAQSGLLLEWRFHKFVNKSLGILGKDAFVLCFDDIDTSFDKGWPVLELLRKHLTTPQIIVLLSGEFALYSKLVRREQWKLFSGNSLFVKHCKRDHLEDEVERLEEQYLTKILPSRKRIDLKCAWELPNDLYFRIPGAGKRTEILLRHIMTAFTKVWFKFPTAICKRIGELFLHMPMRSIVGILKIIDDNGCALAIEYTQRKNDNYTYEHAKLFSGKSELPNYNEFKNLKTPDADQILSVHAALILANQDRLMALGFTQDDLRTVQWSGQFSKLAQVLVDRDIIEHGASLLPSNVMQQDGLEILLLSGIYLSAMLADIKHVCDYYVRVLLIRDIYELMISQNTATEQNKISKSEIKQLTSPQRSLHEIATDIASLLIKKELMRKSSISRHPFLLPDSRLNTRQWYSDAKTKNGKHIADCGTGYANDIDKWGWLILTALTVHAKRKYYISAYNFIALFGLCLGSGTSLGFDLTRFQRIESIDFTNPGSQIASQRRERNIVHADTFIQYVGFNKFTKDVCDWSLEYHEKPHFRESLLLPPYVHANIWNSFCARLRREMNLSITQDHHRSAFESLFFCFTDAIRDEERIFRYSNNGESHIHDLPYYDFVFRCPLWEVLQTLECHSSSSRGNSSIKGRGLPSDSPANGSITKTTSVRSPRARKKPSGSSATPRQDSPAALRAKESLAAPSSKTAPAKQPPRKNTAKE